MPKKRSQNRELAREIFEGAKGRIPLVDIAKHLEVSEGTVRAWKTKDGWERSEKRSDKSQKRSKRKWAENPIITPKNDNAADTKIVLKNENLKTTSERKEGGQSNNKNAIKTSEFAKFYFSDATAEKWAMLDSMRETDVFEHLQATIDSQFMQEWRIREFAKALRENPSMTVLRYNR